VTDHLHFELQVTAPFRLDFTVTVLQRSPQNTLDRWDGQHYRRLMIFGSTPHEVCVSQLQTPHTPTLDIEVSASRIESNAREQTISGLRHALGLQIDLVPFYRMAEHHPRLMALVQPFIGMRPSCFPTLHEALISAVACQQISLSAGIQVLNRLVERYGAVAHYPAPSRAFPLPDTMAQLKPTDLRALGFSTQKAQTIIRLSHLAIEGKLRQEDFETMGNTAIHHRLCEISGIGPWTADYVLLRGFGRLDVFPGKDSGALNGIKAWLNLKHIPDQKQLQRIFTPWRSYAGMIYFHLLLRKRFLQIRSY